MKNKLSIIIIDDDEFFLNCITKDLNTSGFNVFYAITGEEGLKKIFSNKIDLIILDISLPERRDYGFEVCNKLKENPKTSDIPIIFLTGSKDIEVIKQGFKSGCVDYIIKPYQKEELIARISTHLSLKQKTEDLRSIVNQLEEKVSGFRFFDFAIKKELEKLINEYKDHAPNLLFFTHGFGGNANRWDKMISIIKEDRELSIEYEIKKFNYPTTKFIYFGLFKRLPAIENIADALKTEIQLIIDKKKYKKILIVAHSMGGLVARKYLVEQFENILKSDIELNLILYATPNKGSDLANIYKTISIGNIVVSQMCKKSKFLENLNDDWDKYKIINKIDIMYVHAGQDKIVKSDSPDKIFAGKMIKTDINKDHFTIGVPKDKEDTSFELLKNFALKK